MKKNTAKLISNVAAIVFILSIALPRLGFSLNPQLHMVMDWGGATIAVIFFLIYRFSKEDSAG